MPIENHARPALDRPPRHDRTEANPATSENARRLAVDLAPVGNPNDADGMSFIVDHEHHAVVANPKAPEAGKSTRKDFTQFPWVGITRNSLLNEFENAPPVGERKLV
jgi:hypothetical protein